MAYATFAELARAAEISGSLGSAALEREAEESGVARATLLERMDRELAVMEEAIASGLGGSERSRSGLTGGDAALIAVGPGVAGPLFRRVIAEAVAVGETNARMGRVVAAPTAGASGIVPAVLLSLGHTRSLERSEIVSALFAAGAVGAVIASRATLSGAAGGCQAEVGAASAMAAAAGVELLGGGPDVCGQAAALALQGLLGLVCDPVGGLVEVPCVMRNATGSAVALAAIEMAIAGVRFPIPFDEVVLAMGQVGRSLPPSLRETALGGLAATPTGRSLGDRACSAFPAPDRGLQEA
jgi:L-serine dehydratase